MRPIAILSAACLAVALAVVQTTALRAAPVVVVAKVSDARPSHPSGPNPPAAHRT